MTPKTENGNHQISTETENHMKKHESNIRDLWDNIKQANLCIMGIPEGEEKENRIENKFEEIMSENFPNLKETYQNTGSREGPK